MCEATAPLPCSGDIASVLSQWPNEYLEKNKSATSFCSLQLLHFLFMLIFHSCLAMEKLTVSQSTK